MRRRALIAGAAATAAMAQLRPAEGAFCIPPTYTPPPPPTYADAAQQPGTRANPFKIPISSGALFTNAFSAVMTAMAAASATGVLSQAAGNPFSVASSATGVLVNVEASTNVGDSYPVTAFQCYAQAGYMPGKLEPSGGGDHHINLIDTTNRIWLCTQYAPNQLNGVWTGPNGTGTDISYTTGIVAGCYIRYSIGCVRNIDGDMNATDSAFGGSAPHTRYMWGMCNVRKSEIDVPNPSIQHVIRILFDGSVMSQNPAKNSFPNASKFGYTSWNRVPAPNYQVDYFYATAGSSTEYLGDTNFPGSGGIPATMLFAIPPTTALSSIIANPTPVQYALLYAMQKFGCMFRDTCGAPNQFAVDVEQGTSTTTLNQMVTAIRALIPFLRGVYNPNMNASGQLLYPPWGGGTPNTADLPLPIGPQDVVPSIGQVMWA